MKSESSSLINFFIIISKPFSTHLDVYLSTSSSPRPGPQWSSPNSREDPASYGTTTFRFTEFALCLVTKAKGPSASPEFSA
jgi:hypothetical protein